MLEVGHGCVNLGARGRRSTSLSVAQVVSQLSKVLDLVLNTKKEIERKEEERKENKERERRLKFCVSQYIGVSKAAGQMCSHLMDFDFMFLAAYIFHKDHT